METIVPTAGRIVHYRLRDSDAEEINRRRTNSGSIAERITNEKWPIGAQAHIGNNVTGGDVYPMLIVQCWGTLPDSLVNGQVFLDGNDTYWATSVGVGDDPGCFRWPSRS